MAVNQLRLRIFAELKADAHGALGPTAADIARALGSSHGEVYRELAAMAKAEMVHGGRFGEASPMRWYLGHGKITMEAPSEP